MIEIGPQEKIVKIVRKHWFVLLGAAIYYLVLLVVPFAVLAAVLEFPVFAPIAHSGHALFLGLVAAFLWLFLIWNAAFLTVTDYLLDVFVVTDQRVFDIDQRGLFRRKSATFRIDRIQDVTVQVRGIIATFLDFGDIHIHTAGEGPDFVGCRIARPYEVKKFINEAIDHWTLENRNVSVVESVGERAVGQAPVAAPNDP